MLVNKIVNYQVFGSKNSPVKPFVVETNRGNLKVREISKRDIKEASKFNFDISVNSFEDWAEYRNADSASKKHALSYLEDLIKHCMNKKDGNSTILIAERRKK